MDDYLAWIGPGLFIVHLLGGLIVGEVKSFSRFLAIYALYTGSFVGAAIIWMIIEGPKYPGFSGIALLYPAIGMVFFSAPIAIGIRSIRWFVYQRRAKPPAQSPYQSFSPAWPPAPAENERRDQQTDDPSQQGSK